MQDLVVLGTGNVDIIRLIEDINSDKKVFNFIGFLEKDENLIGNNLYNYPILGTDDLLLSKFSKCAVINNVMNTPNIHETVTNKIIELYKIRHLPNLVHPDVDLRYMFIGKGNIIYKNTFFGTNTIVGDFNVFYGGKIGHETLFGNNNLFAGNLIGSRCIIGNNNLFGNSSTISNNLKIGNNNIIGVGSIVMKNVDSNNHVLGYPAIDAVEFMKKNYWTIVRHKSKDDNML